MAVVLTSKSRTARLVFSGDPSLRRESLAPDLRAENAAAKWVSALPGDADDGVTIAEVRALSWLEWTEVEALTPDRQVLRVVELGLVSFGGDTAQVSVFLAAPAADLVVPLYRAISDLTWGN